MDDIPFDRRATRVAGVIGFPQPAEPKPLRVLVVEDSVIDARPYFPAAARPDLDMHLAIYDVSGSRTERNIRKRLGILNSRFGAVFAGDMDTLLGHVQSGQYDAIFLDGLNGRWEQFIAGLGDEGPQVIMTSANEHAREQAAAMGYPVIGKFATASYGFC